MQWRRRRVERAIARLTRQIATLREEIEVTRAQLGSLSSEADHATTDAVVRPSNLGRQEAGRARASYEGHARMVDDQLAQLERLQHRRDELLESLAAG